jgi:hypothetical protein
MSAQRLGDKKIRRLARDTGLPVVRAWAHGGYIYDFVTQGHLHGWYSLKSGEWGIENGYVVHYNTCEPRSGEIDELFPDGVPPLTEAERKAVNGV